jgi:polyether ionophore transport system permease protein
MGLAYGIVADDLARVPRLVGASLAYIPALWLLVGLAIVLDGLAPGGALAAWGGLAVCFVIGLLGGVLDIPGWLSDASPFQHTPQLPAHGLAVLPLILLTGIAVALMAAGVTAFGSRDVG